MPRRLHTTACPRCRTLHRFADIAARPSGATVQLDSPL